MKQAIPRTLVLVLLVASAGVAVPETSPYAGQETRGIKALSQSHVEGLLAGRGLGYARAAELNGYPGPLHVLELAEELGLTEEQRNRTQEIFDEMQASARSLGAELVAAEAALDEQFSSRSIDEASLLESTGRIGSVEAQLRAVHLHAHLRQTELLSAQQIARYMRLRGYGRGDHGHGHAQDAVHAAPGNKEGGS